jgi:membrane protein DedA with SNARE-associated domain
MHAFIADVGEFISTNREWAAPILGLLTFLESMAFIGGFFPATALMVLAGGLIAAGVLDPVSVLAWCIAGATIGDAVSYWIGRKIGPRAWRNRFLKPHRRTAARARLFFRKYGSASIYLCRFLGPVRAFVPLIAGMTKMNHRRFQVANIGSALVWVPVMIAPGWLAAKGVSGLGAITDPEQLAVLLGLGLVLSLIVGLVWRRLRHKLVREGAPRRRA